MENESYGEMWYYTKLNEDNAWSQATGGPPEPDAQGHWPLRENGGHGFAWDVSRQQQTRQYGWHRYGAWSAWSQSWRPTFRRPGRPGRSWFPAGTQGEYDMEIVPRDGQ